MPFVRLSGDAHDRLMGLAMADALIGKLREAGVRVQAGEDSVQVEGIERLRAVDTTTVPYPGFPTDMQAQMMSLMSIVSGVSIITEKVYPDRFMHIAELNRMGAHIQRQGPHAIIEGVRQLCGAKVMASDLRASASLVLAGLAARDQTSISRIYHLERGYDNFDEKLRELGASIYREKE